MKQENYSKTGLIILAILEILPNSTREEIIDYSVKSLYLNYFSAAETLESLMNQHLIHASINKGETEMTASGKPVYRLNLTNEGHAVLNALKKTLPKPIFSFLAQLSQKSTKEKQLTAKYKMDANQRFVITLAEGNEKEQVISLSLTVPNEKSAKQICQKWREEADVLYQKILQWFLQE